MIPGRQRSPGRRRAAALALLAVGLASAAGAAESQQERRSRTGLRLFRAALAADEGLELRTLDDGRLPVAFFYVDDPERAAELLEGFASRDEAGEPLPIRDRPLALTVTDDPAFPEWEGRPPVGIFLTQDPGEEVLAEIVRYGIAHGVIVFSPFEGHVERGVLGGVAVGAQIRVHLNTRTLEASHVVLRDFFVRLARLHP